MGLGHCCQPIRQGITMAKITDSTKHDHTHIFLSDGGACKDSECKAISITRDEFKTRCKAWDEVYQKSKESPSAKNFEIAIKAYKTGNKAVLLECARRAKLRLEEGNYLPKPSFDDPRSHAWKTYIINEKITDLLYHDPSGDY